MIFRMLLLVALCFSSARALDISGTILETGTNKPIAGAQVCLAPDLLACVDAQSDGAFRITDSATVAAVPFGKTIRAGRIAVQHGRLVVDLSLVKTCRLEVFGIDGRLVERSGEMAGGMAWWPASRTRPPRDGVYIVRLTGDFGQAICKVETMGGFVVSANGASRIGGFAYRGTAKRAAGTQDTLVIGWNGYETFSYVPTNATETGVTIHLTPFVVAPLSDSVGFVRNDDLKKTAVLDTGAFSLSVTDKSGLVWTLVVPASPFSTKTAISMVPISPAGSSTIQGGVLFEPDGYYFSIPAKLIVTGATTPLAITTFNQNGSNAGLAAYQKTAGPDTIDIFHFSGAGGQDAGTYNNQAECTADEAQMKVAIAERDALLKTEVFVPEPPSIRNECYYELDAASQARNDSLICQYTRLFELPEAQIIRNVLAITRRECFFQCATCDETFSYVAPLAARLQKKINLAMKKYISGQAGVQNAEKYHALGIALISAEKTLAILGLSTAANEEDVLFSVGTWASKLSDEYLRRLREEHDYAAQRIILPFRHDAEILGVSTGSIDDYYSAMTNALTFLMTITATVDESGAEHAQYVTKTSLLQYYVGNSQWQTDDSDDHCGYKTYGMPCKLIEASTSQDGSVTPLGDQGSGYWSRIHLDYNACADSGCSCSDSAFKLQIQLISFPFKYRFKVPNLDEGGGFYYDTAWFDASTVFYDVMPQCNKDLQCPEQLMTECSACYPYYFTAPINNKVETAVDETYLGTYDESGVHIDASVHIVMKHTPK
jgi:hypothetical protein